VPPGTGSDATFVVGDSSGAAGDVMPAVAERNFGRPAAIYRVAGQLILVYDKSLLAGLPPVRPVEAS
jgi:hypothetical protein